MDIHKSKDGYPIFRIILDIHNSIYWYIHKNIWATSWQNQQNDCAPSEDSDQPGHSLSLISLRCALNGQLRTQAFFMWTAKTDQTGRMPRLICVFAGCTCHFVGLLMRKLIFGYQTTNLIFGSHNLIFWISMIHFLNIHNLVFGYPNFPLNTEYQSF